MFFDDFDPAIDSFMYWLHTQFLISYTTVHKLSPCPLTLRSECQEQHIDSQEIFAKNVTKIFQLHFYHLVAHSDQAFYFQIGNFSKVLQNIVNVSKMSDLIEYGNLSTIDCYEHANNSLASLDIPTKQILLKNEL